MGTTLKYDTPFEVSKQEHDFLMKEFAGIVAGREEEGKYFIKVFLMKYAKHVEIVLGQFKRLKQ